MGLFRRRTVFATSLLLSAAFAIGAGCGGDDTNGGSSTDSGTAFDGTTSGDAAPRDGASPTDASADAPADANVVPPHVVFLTSTTFTGDLLSQAGAVESDAGLDAGLTSDAGDGGTDYLRASDILCTHVAHAAGLKGSFAAILTAGSDDVLARFADADGPWALADGTPVADTIADLAAGKWRAAIDLDEKGTPQTSGSAWSRGTSGFDCEGWSTASAGSIGQTGLSDTTGRYALGNAIPDCSQSFPIYCAQVGPGAGPNRTGSVPAGGKTVFATDLPVPPNFALPDAGVVDGSAPTGDTVHGAADDVCNQVAKGAGRSGTYHAWVSSTVMDAKTYFTSLSMNGPWYRPDGALVASSLTDLDTNGAHTQIEIGANGVILDDPTSRIWTGTKADGTVGTNCSDFTTLSAAEATGSRASNKNTYFTNANLLSCDSADRAGLYCFEQ